MPDRKPPSVPRPGRALAALAVLLVLVAVVMIVGHAIHPRLAIDLAGGTSVTLVAKPGTGSAGEITPEAMNQAVGIIRQRVNSTGVTEAEVAVRGGDQIVVTVPGQHNQHLVDLIGQTALNLPECADLARESQHHVSTEEVRPGVP
jgi:preprotein translocase subunit SecD